MAAYLGGHATETISEVSDRAQVRPASSMELALSELASKVSSAELGVERLVDGLKPVLSGRDMTETSDVNPSPSPNCELEERILQLAHRVDAMSETLARTFCKLCV